MSNNSNERLILQAREVSENWVGTPIPEIIDALIKNNELDELRAVLVDIETGEAFKGIQNEVRYA
jgi:hypothetical protein